MRHGVKGRKLGRKTPHRLALFRNQLASLVEHERIITTLAKAKELRPLAEKIERQSDALDPILEGLPNCCLVPADHVNL